MQQRLRLKSAVKNAGIYHVGTGMWTRPGAQEAQSGAGLFHTIYNNTCSSPFFGAIYPGETWTDEGALPDVNKVNKRYDPAQNSVAAFVGAVNECPEGGHSAPGQAQGSASTYSIAGFTIGYCSDISGPQSVPAGPGARITVDFRQTTHLDAMRCAQGPLAAPAPQASFSLVNFPGAGAGPFSCWQVAIDLSAPSAGFSMLAAGNGNSNNPPNQNSGATDLKHCFSWSFSFPGITSPTTTAASGMMFAGNPNNGRNGWVSAGTTGGGSVAECSGYDGTVWDKWNGGLAPIYFPAGAAAANGASGTLAAVSAGGEPGTGMNTQDAYRVDLTPATSVNGCYFFGGPSVGSTNAFSSFHLELYTLSASVNTISGIRSYGPYGANILGGNGVGLTNPNPGSGFCYGDGCAFTCPCVAPNIIPDPQGGHDSGCANTNPLALTNLHGARLEVQGNPVVGAGDTIKFKAVTGTTGWAFFVKSHTNSPNGSSSFPADGIDCWSGVLVRIGNHNVGTLGAPGGVLGGQWEYPNIAQTTSVSAASGQIAGQFAWYQLYYRNPAAGFCTPNNWNLSNGQALLWKP